MVEPIDRNLSTYIEIFPNFFCTFQGEDFLNYYLESFIFAGPLDLVNSKSFSSRDYRTTSSGFLLFFSSLISFCFLFKFHSKIVYIYFFLIVSIIIFITFAFMKTFVKNVSSSTSHKKTPTLWEFKKSLSNTLMN